MMIGQQIHVVAAEPVPVSERDVGAEATQTVQMSYRAEAGSFPGEMRLPFGFEQMHVDLRTGIARHLENQAQGFVAAPMQVRRCQVEPDMVRLTPAFPYLGIKSHQLG